MASFEGFNEIEKMLKKDSSNMKSIGRGVFKRASRKGFIRGGVKTPYDYMTAKQKRELNGEVKVYMLHQEDIKNVKPMNEILEMEPTARLKYFSEVMAAHTARNLCKHWKFSTSTLYNKYIPQIGYQKNSEASAKKAGRKKMNKTENQNNTKETLNKNNETSLDNKSNNDSISNTQITSSNNEKTITVEENNQPTINQTNNNKHIFSNQEFNFKGQYDSSRLDAIYNKLKFLLDNGVLYDVEISIKETEKQA